MLGSALGARLLSLHQETQTFIKKNIKKQGVTLGEIYLSVPLLRPKYSQIALTPLKTLKCFFFLQTHANKCGAALTQVFEEVGLQWLWLLLPRSPGDETHTLGDSRADSSSKCSATQLFQSKCAPCQRDSKGKRNNKES